MTTHEETGGPCLGFIIGVAIAIPVYGGLAWALWAAWNRFTPWYITYWQALGVVLFLATGMGIIIVLVGLRRKEKKGNTP